MEVKIGVINVPSQVVIDSPESADEIRRKLAAALESQGIFELTDSKGASVMVPATQIGYLEIGAETKARVGFGIG